MAVKRNLFNDKIFIIDMSSLKELLDRYPRGLIPSIWERIDELISNSQLISHIEALREIKATIYPKDKLLIWSSENKKVFLGIDECQNQRIKLIKKKYTLSHWQNKLNRPNPWADPYILAMAICERAVIITQENKTKNERIPAIAGQMEVRSINLLEFFDELKTN